MSLKHTLLFDLLIMCLEGVFEGIKVQNQYRLFY
jgi:hypothetical protein